LVIAGVAWQQHQQALFDQQSRELKDAMQAVLQQGLVPIAQLTKLALVMNLKPASYSNKSEDYRAPALAAYKVSKDNTVLCQVSDRYFPAAQVTAAHIVRLEWSAVAVSIFSSVWQAAIAALGCWCCDVHLHVIQGLDVGLHVIQQVCCNTVPVGDS
jgi:hypothetical protein